MNVIVKLYETPLQWQSLAGRFLDGSNQLANMPIQDINYMSPQYQRRDKGYYGALTNAVEAGINKAPLTLDMLVGWKQLILEEMQKSGTLKKDDIEDESKKEEILSLISEINQKISEISEIKNNIDEINIISLLSNIIFVIESKQLFAPIQRRICHLVMNYLMSYFNMPIIVFTPIDRPAYLSSIDNELKLRIFLAEKVREAVFFRGLLLKKVGGMYASEWYKHEDSPSKKDLVIEWHELFEAVRHWKEELENESKSVHSQK